MRHYAAPEFWVEYRVLPVEIRRLAEKAFELLKADPHHPSLHFKKIGRFWSARVGLRHRALAVQIPEGVLWFWIGTHTDYDSILR